MKIYNGSPRHRQRVTPASRRAQLLAAFDRSRLSAAAFARRHGIGYSTLCAWRHHQAKTKPSPGFVQVEVSEPIAPVELVIELGAQARVRVTSDRQIELAVRLIERFNTPAAC